MFARIRHAISSAPFSLLLIGMMAFLPFMIAYHRLPIASFYGEWLAGLLGVLSLLPLFKKASWQPLEIPHIALVFAGLIAIVSMQLMLGMLQSKSYGLLVIAYLLWAFLLVILGGYLRRELGWEKVSTTLAWAIVAGGIVNIVFVALQYVLKTGVHLPFMPNFYAYGTVGQLNHFANYMALAMASLLYLLFKKRITFAVAVVVGLLFLCLLAFSGSRSSWLYLVIIIALASIFRAMSLRQSTTTSALQIKQSKQLLWLSLLLLPLFACMQWVVGWLSNGVVAMPNARLMAELGGAQQIGGLAVRLHIWYESFLLFLQSPWLGIGFGQTRWMSFYMLDKQWLIDLPGSYEHAHNLVIHLLAETGLAGCLLLLAGVFAWLRGFQWKNIHLETWYMLALLGIIGVHSLLEYPLWYAYFLGLTAFLLGAGDEKRHQLNVPAAGRAIGRFALLLVFVAANALLINALAANKALDRWVSLGIQGQINTQNQAAFYRDMDWVAQHSILSPYTNVIYAIALKPNKKNLSDKLALSHAALRFLPTRATAYRYVLMLELNNQHAQAVLYLQRAIQAFPHDFKPELQKMPLQYWDRYLKILGEAIAKPPAANKT